MSQTEKVVATLQTLATGATGQATHHDIAAQIFASQGFTKLSDKYTGHATEERDFAGQFMARIRAVATRSPTRTAGIHRHQGLYASRSGHFTKGYRRIDAAIGSSTIGYHQL